jgi:hypothetical protein
MKEFRHKKSYEPELQKRSSFFVPSGNSQGVRALLPIAGLLQRLPATKQGRKMTACAELLLRLPRDQVIVDILFI